MDLLATNSAEDESDELFSDDEQKKEIKCRANVSQDASVLSRSETPLSLIDNPNTIMPTDAVIPSTPLSLLPFLNKINEQWTSDLETPQAQPRKPMTSSTGRTEETPSVEQHTPDVSTVTSVDKIISGSPVIVSRATRRRSKRCIFRSSIDPLAMINNEDITVNVQIETPVISDNANFVAHDTTNIAISNPSLENTFKDCEPRVLNKSQDTCNNEETEKFTDAVPDNLNTSTQEFFSNISFSKLDELCSDAFNNQKTIETTAVRCNYEQNIESIDKGRNVEENKNIGFFTARGASINVSKQALFKAKRLFADAFDTDEKQTQNYESFAKRNSNEQKNTPSSSLANNVSVNIVEEVLAKPKPLTEQLKNYEKVYIADCKKPLVHKSSSEDKALILFSTASGNPINISKEALLKAKTLLADESDNDDEDVLIKYYEGSSADKNSITAKNMALPSFSATNGTSINISGKSLAKARTLFAEQSDTTVEFTSNKADVEENKNTGFFTARGASINVSKQALVKAKRLFADAFDTDEKQTQNYESFAKRNSNEQKNTPSSSLANNVSVNIVEEVLAKPKPLTEQLKNYEKVYIADCKKPLVHKSSSEDKAPILFSTASGNPINISKEALLKAKTLLADESDNDDEDVLIKYYEGSSADKNSITAKNMALPSFSATNGTSINISGKSLAKARTLFAEQSDTTVEFTSNKADVEENKNTGFFTARGASINVSKQALVKAKRLFADAFDTDEKQTQNYESFAKRNSNEQKNRDLPSSSFANNVSVNIVEEVLAKPKPLTEQLKNYDKVYIGNCKKSLVNKSSNEDKTPILFSTASGNPINISKEALLKAKALLANESDNADDVLIKYYEESSADKNSMTAKNMALSSFSATSTPIGGKSLAKARTLFAEQSDTNTELTSNELISNKIDISNEQCVTNTSNIGFYTTCDTSKQVHSKAKVLFTEQLDDSIKRITTKEIHNNGNEIKRQAKVSKIGFQTAYGKPINISEQALSKAKALFADLDDTLEAVAPEETNAPSKKVKGLEIKTPNIRFQSVGNTSIDISEQKAKVSLERLDDQVESVIANKANKTIIDDKVKSRQEIKIPSIGFQTARGTSINISEQALSRAKALFADQLDRPSEMDILENIGCHNEKIKKRDLTIPHGGLQTASDQRVPVSNNAALMARELFFNDCLDESNPDLGRASLQKRKLSETNADESTPLGRNYTSETKKARFSNEYQARKLFFNNPSVDTDNDENQDPEKKKQAAFIVDSALGSPGRDATEPTESNAAGSPVIGRQPIPRKRKSLEGHQRDEYSAPRADKRTLDSKNIVSQEDVVQGSASRGKIEDDKSDTDTQKATQAAKEKARGNSTESSEYGDTQVMMDFIDESTKILQARLAAALEQEAIITAKRRHGSKQLVGHLYRYKQINSNARLSLREIGGGTPPTPRSYQDLVDRRIPPGILDITAATATTYRFRCSDFYGNDVAHGNVRGIEMEDGVHLILDENGYAGVWEVLRAFLAGPGVDPNLVPARWVENHYRWIVWKLASMDRMKFGSAELPRALTPSRVMAQLKYRYDREIDRSQRPAIRRILEKDDVASKRMVLCVSSIVENNNVSIEIGKSPRIGVPRWRIELTDGWYSVNACIDIGMVRSISIGKIREGTKLVMSGAELLNCDRGFYPLEAPADVCLKLHTNSTRRARWDTKLGYALCSGPIPIKLRNVCPSGGLIGKMTIVVARVYPMLYHEKTASGDSIVRNAKSEEKAQSKYEQQCWSKIEAFYAKAEDCQGKGLSCETDDMAIQLSEDYENLSTEESVSKKRHDELLQELRQREERFKQRMQSKLRESLPGPRQVSQLLKVRVCDENANAILSVWSPSEEIVDALKEGTCVSLCNVVASGKRGTELQLTARRSAIFKPRKMLDVSYPARVCTSLCEIANSEFAPPYGEFDTVGLVCSVGPAPYGMKDFEAVHLAYCKAGSSNCSYLSILFWQGIAGYGYAEILTVGSIVACSNLEWRRATSWNVPAAYCTDRSTFTRNPRRNHLHESFENLRNLITDPIKYTERCTFELNMELQKKSTPTRYTAGKNTPIKIYSSTSSVDKKLVDYTSPLATPKLGTSSNNSNFIASNPAIQKRLEKLHHYGEAPELSPIILKKSKRISLDFRSPIHISDINSTKETSSANQPADLNIQRNTTKKN